MCGLYFRKLTNCGHAGVKFVSGQKKLKVDQKGILS